MANLPPPVHPGDRVGVAALSGPVDPGRLATGLEALAAIGYQPVEASNLRSCCGIFAGSDEERLDVSIDVCALQAPLYFRCKRYEVLVASYVVEFVEELLQLWIARVPVNRTHRNASVAQGAGLTRRIEQVAQ